MPSSSLINVSQSALIWFTGFMAIFLIGSILSFSFMIATNVSSVGKSGPSGPQGPQGKDGNCNLTDSNSSSPVVVQNLTIFDILNMNPGSVISFQNDSQGIQGDEECLLLYSEKGICIDSPKITNILSKGIAPELYSPNITTSLFYLSTQICFTKNYEICLV